MQCEYWFEAIANIQFHRDWGCWRCLFNRTDISQPHVPKYNKKEGLTKREKTMMKYGVKMHREFNIKT